MTIDQMEGNVNGNGDMVGDIGDNHDKDNTDRKLGEDDFIDEKGDPPRVWLSDKNVPGTSFTRSLGDSIANKVGVFAEPEFFSKTITDEDEILVLASDGVFEFLQNQEIIDICAKSDNPVKACELVVDAAYTKWLEYENRTDDITAIIMYFRREQARGVNVDNDNDNDGEVTVPQAAK
jgi:serine/threonine protein phosphatase PrpC